MRCKVAPTSGGALVEGVVSIVVMVRCRKAGLPSSGSAGNIHYIEFQFEIPEKVRIIELVQNTVPA
jgi:hypothetical protein